MYNLIFYNETFRLKFASIWYCLPDFIGVTNSALQVVSHAPDDLLH